MSKWLDLLKTYNEKSVLFDDPILQNYYDEISPKFIVTDENADSAPFDFERQGRLLEIYDRVRLLVEKEKTSENAEEAETIVKEIDAAKASTSKETKRQAMQRFQKIVAMCMKYSYAVGRAILAEVFVEAGKQLLLGI